MRRNKDASIPIKPDERDIPGIIRVLVAHADILMLGGCCCSANQKANIDASRGGPLKPDVVFTKGEMAYLIEILEEKLKRQ